MHQRSCTSQFLTSGLTGACVNYHAGGGFSTLHREVVLSEPEETPNHYFNIGGLNSLSPLCARHWRPVCTVKCQPAYCFTDRLRWCPVGDKMFYASW